jgi:hypothetical protein
MSLVEETNFAIDFLSSLSSRPVRYPQDFAPPPQTRQKLVGAKSAWLFNFITSLTNFFPIFRLQLHYRIKVKNQQENQDYKKFHKMLNLLKVYHSFIINGNSIHS